MFTRSARRHRIGRARVPEAMQNAYSVTSLPTPDGFPPKLRWVGPDGRGLVLEVIAIVDPGLLLVIHAMPVHDRRGDHGTR